MASKKIDRFVSPSLSGQYPEHRKIGCALKGMQLQNVEIVISLDELREILTSVWFVALSRRRADPDKPTKLTIITEIPV